MNTTSAVEKREKAVDYVSDEDIKVRVSYPDDVPENIRQQKINKMYDIFLSLSISAQREECIRFVGDCEYQVYCDDGKSGKDVQHRPAFMQMMSNAREGLISRIVVKKYDRFSRNMREYLNITDELDRYGVTVYSLSESFNTETKEGRMMRNNLLNFAEFERETIAARVADAFQTKARETGFYQGGKVQFGYTPERRTINGKTGSVLVPSENAEAVRVAYDLYQHPENSLTDIIRYMTENGINASRPTPRTKTGISNLDRSHLSRILENPLYVRADKEVYRYFLSKGYEMLDDIEAYDGIHGLFVHAGLDDTHFVKVAYHEGLVPAETWLRVQDRKSHQSKFPTNGKAMNSWLVGMVKCACCGYAMHFNHCANRKGVVYHRFIDYGKFTLNGCPTPPIQLKPRQVEDAVLKEMQKRIEQLKIAKRSADAHDADSEALRAEIIKIDEEIRKLMKKLGDADTVLFEYIQNTVNELHEQKAALERKMQAKARKRRTVDTAPLEKPMKHWDKLSIPEKHELAAVMLEAVYVSDENGIEVKFSI